MKSHFKPVSSTKRIEVVDALRGFALLGVLFANIPFGGSPPIESVYDETIHFLYNFFISKKFITIFSMLFGFGFYIQFSRAQKKVVNFNSYFLKRMALLFVIGCIHSFVLWNGDILMSYAFGGAFLLLVRNFSIKKLIVLAVAFNVVLTGATFIGNSALGWAVYDYDFSMVTELGLTNSYVEYLRMNWITSPWVNFLNDMPLTLFYTFGNMLLGMILGKIHFFNTEGHLKSLRRWFVILGAALGIPASYYFHLLMTGQLELDLPLLWVPFAIIVGMLFQSLAYITLFTELYKVVFARKILSGFKYVGKTALTNYLGQSVFYLIAIYHCTNLFQLYGKLSEPQTYLLAAVFFIMQAMASFYWLKRWKQGPVEQAWRSLSYSSIKLGSKMKTVYIVIAMIFLMPSLFGQNRIAENVSFKSGEETITGILIKPHMGDNMPAVVFQQGSGDFAFDGYEKEAWGPHKFYIEDVLLDQGYAVLYCNKRGLGGSTGNWRKNDFYGRADDALAAIEYLKSLKEIDAKRIGVSGHSQGGWIAQIVASKNKDVAFILCLAGPAVGVKDQIYSHDRFQFKCEGYDGEKLEKKIQKRKNGLEKSYKIGKNSGIVGAARHLYLIFDYDNDEVLKSIECPALYLFAEFDINVNPEENINHLNLVFENKIPENFTVKIMANGQHGFYKVENGCVPWEEAAKNDFDRHFQAEIRDWLIGLNK